MRPVARAHLGRGVTPTLIFTGQHKGLNPAEFGLEKFPRMGLGEPGRENPHAHVGAVTKALLPLLRRELPDLLAVQGDTSSALGAALAGFTADIAVAHVEAGLRTYDPRLPWPEEEYRVAIDAQAELLFAPTEISAGNLRAENVPGTTHVTGNTSIDALLEVATVAPPRPHSQGRRILVTCHRRESWREGLAAIAAAVSQIAAEGSAAVDFILHPNPFVADSMRRMLAGHRGVRLIEACSHSDLLRLMMTSDLVLSDSGGVQEEAPALGVPLLVLRDKTERPEGLTAGTSLLVGTDSARIAAEVQRLFANPATLAAMSRRVFPFGDGNAGRRIGSIIIDWLQQRSLTRAIA